MRNKCRLCGGPKPERWNADYCGAVCRKRASRLNDRVATLYVVAYDLAKSLENAGRFSRTTHPEAMRALKATLHYVQTIMSKFEE